MVTMEWEDDADIQQLGIVGGARVDSGMVGMVAGQDSAALQPDTRNGTRRW